MSADDHTTDGGGPSREEYRRLAVKGAASEIRTLKQELDGEVGGLIGRLEQGEDPSPLDYYRVQLQLLSAVEEVHAAITPVMIGSEPADARELRELSLAIATAGTRAARERFDGEPVADGRARLLAAELDAAQDAIATLREHGGVEDPEPDSGGDQ